MIESAWRPGDPPMTAAVTVVTKEMTDATAAMARQMEPTPRDDPEWATSPRWPWDAPAPLDRPGIDCTTLDAGRTPQQEKAA